MEKLRSPVRILLVLSLLFIFSCLGFTVADAQNLPQLPAPRNPSNDCGCSRGDDAIPVSSGMLAPFLPRIPNLELGYLYYFGNNVRTGRFTADYVLPFHLSADSVLFGEAHGEGWDFWKRSSGATNNRIDLSLGGGYRTMLGANTLVGVNGFYDTSRVFNKWYSSGGVGLEYAANVAGDDAIDLNFNWYGNLFNRDVLINAFRYKGNSFDVEAGYSHALFNRSLDLRLKVIGYQFDIGNAVQGWRGGADLTTRDGVFTARYEYGHDLIDGYYNTVGGFVNVGFQLENLLSGESPFTTPEPVFRSPRDLRRLLGLKVKRNWHQPTPVSRCSDSLPGAVFLATTIDPNVHYTVATPMLLTAATNQITVCWCGALQADALINVVFVLANTRFVASGFPAGQFHITSSPGCATVNVTTNSHLSPTHNEFVLNTPHSIQFAPGGGISFQFSP